MTLTFKNERGMCKYITLELIIKIDDEKYRVCTCLEIRADASVKSDNEILKTLSRIKILEGLKVLSGHISDNKRFDRLIKEGKI